MGLALFYTSAAEQQRRFPPIDTVEHVVPRSISDEESTDLSGKTV
jgi:hypothetical protein